MDEMTFKDFLGAEIPLRRQAKACKAEYNWYLGRLRAQLISPLII
jgi:hypothetical protein